MKLSKLNKKKWEKKDTPNVENAENWFCCNMWDYSVKRKYNNP